MRDLLEPPVKTKRECIIPLLTEFPNRRFIFVGDRYNYDVVFLVFSLSLSFGFSPAARLKSLALVFPNYNSDRVFSSTELDPEIFAGISTEFPRQVLAIFIRRVRDGTADNSEEVRIFSIEVGRLWIAGLRPSALSARIRESSWSHTLLYL